METDTQTETAIQEMGTAARKEQARRKLVKFAQFIDPAATRWYSAPHLAQIAAKLEAVERGEIKRLFITCPPRHWKSSLASEKFPLWFLARHPKAAVILASYAESLSEKFSRTIRDSITSNDRFRELFPGVQLEQGRGGVHDWSLTGAIRSTLRCVGTGGGVTGMGAQLIVIDDPVADALEAGSKTQRDRVWDWYQQTLRTRLEPDGAIVLIMSRWHEDDLAGRLLKASRDKEGEAWEVVHLPAISEANEPLWSDRWSLKELEAIKLASGSRAFAALYQGSPRAQEGSILDSRKLVMLDADNLPHLVKVYRRWDLAFSDRVAADWVAGAKMGRDARGHIYILHIKRKHGKWPDSKPMIMETAIADGPSVRVAIEANGTQLGYFQDIHASPQMAGRVVVEDKPEGTKEMRASMWGSRLCDGLIHCVRGPWNELFFDEMDAFPNGTNDDQVDAVSGGYLKLVNQEGAFESADQIIMGGNAGRTFRR